MLSEHKRNYGLGVDALVTASSWNTTVIMTLLWFGYGCSGHRVPSEHERYRLWFGDGCSRKGGRCGSQSASRKTRYHNPERDCANRRNEQTSPPDGDAIYKPLAAATTTSNNNTTATTTTTASTVTTTATACCRGDCYPAMTMATAEVTTKCCCQCFCFSC